jgi:2-amino-4-hydroxy-6-hydroxymethyldihydropteridine diphosphokinase
MNRAIIGLGSNINPHQNIWKAKKTLSQKFRLVAESSFKWTKPVSEVQQADFINGAVLIETKLSIEQLKNTLKKIETDIGRVGTDNRQGPRMIDLDIVAWNETIVDPNFYERSFLKESVLELIPNLKY